MATASSFLCEDQFLCAICLDLFTEPVSIPCGHNFCRACLTQHWDNKTQCQCPLCNEKFNRGLKLCVNTAFRDVVESFKELRAAGEGEVESGQVPCDSCLGNKSRAHKTCLVCLASFCEPHLKPHLRVPAFKTHKLVDPVQHLEDKICREHNRVLELFCRNDWTRVCVLCADHSDHDTVPLEEDHVDKGAQMKKRPAVEGRNKKEEAKTRACKQHEREGNSEKTGSDQKHTDSFPVELVWKLFIPRPDHLGVSYGTWFYVVPTGGKTCWDVGVARGSVRRDKKSNCMNGKWLVRLGHCKYATARNIPVLGRKPERLMVCVDYESRLVFFCDAATCTVLDIIFGCEFRETVFLFQRSNHPSHVKCAQRRQGHVTSVECDVACLTAQRPSQNVIYWIFLALLLGMFVYMTAPPNPL